ncbi:type I-U CRISPR-associated protein Csb2 [Bifidobacterium sp. ESL0763]|uniref:type I-G CRISPR-associated protein Csb2 n=1 Tax=Bifidobacterium sp. ESL0763 TaxID=2983227 RepID=UPI0023F6296A|nr:type I-U CRISPR-associated protein Csb2 [Bifidobacterium sp. ESL0763]MDF7663610.1 type I-U CRISPR-associated protein Csb2 [Bifidobacterium sp. ESL0763]
MSFIISVHFLMGTYQGADDTGRPEAYPSPERLYKALVSVAHTVFGFRSGVSAEEEHLSDDAIAAALQWFERNPPDAIYLPRKIRRNGRRKHDTFTYRDKGYWNKAQGVKTIDAVTGRQDIRSSKASRVGIATAYDDDEADGNLAWQWAEAPDEHIREALARLCWEVPYLGEACSPVSLSAHEMGEGTYPLSGSLEIDRQLSLRHASISEEFQVPDEGHLQELEDGYAQANPKKKTKKIAFSEHENTVVSDSLTQHVRNVGYLRPSLQDDSKKLRAPWSLGVFIPVEVLGDKQAQWQPRESQYVAWCVALHRLLVRLGGYGVTPVLTGKYEPDIERPANNVAIQILSDGGLPIAPEMLERMNLPGFLVMIPRSASGADVSTIISLCESLKGRRLYFSKNYETLRLGEAVTDIDLSQFWESVRTGCRRFWTPSPFCLRETRSIPSEDPGKRWKAREDMALAVGHVWRKNFKPSAPCASKEEEYWGFVDNVLETDSPAGIVSARIVARTQMGDYAHRSDPSTPLLGVMASMRLDLVTEREVVAIGQSRHLGGGLLVPVDYPERLADDIVGGGRR